MTNENVATVETVETKRSLNEATAYRINWEKNSLARKLEIKAKFEAKLATDEQRAASKGYQKNLASIKKTKDLISSLEEKLAGRLSKAETKLQAAPANEAPVVEAEKVA
jgi:hypothetical protein